MIKCRWVWRGSHVTRIEQSRYLYWILERKYSQKSHLEEIRRWRKLRWQPFSSSVLSK